MNRNLCCLTLLLSILMLFPLDTQAQYNYRSRRNNTSERETGSIVVLLGAGIAAVKSDICGSWGCNEFGPAVSVGALYKLTTNLGISGTVDYVKLGATEKDPRQIGRAHV